jgi:hypothetical protein
MTTFPRFNPSLFLGDENRRAAPAKAANVAKLNTKIPLPVPTLAGLATLAGVDGQFREPEMIVPAPIPDPSDAAASAGMQIRVQDWRVGVALLSAASPVGDLSASAWAMFVGDCRSFVEGEWAARAAALDWDARQLFGCHRDRPHLVTWRGVLWFLAGGQIVAMSEDTARIKTVRGAPGTVMKMKHPYDFIVPVWEVR